MKEMNVSRWKLPWIAKDFIRLMKERDQDVYMFEGMRDHLIELHNRGYTLAIITSNSKENCQSLLGAELCELLLILMVARLYLAKLNELSVF